MPGVRLLRQHVIGRHFRIGTLDLVDAEPKSTAGRAHWWPATTDTPAQVRHLDLARTRRHSQRGQKEDAERDSETGSKQEESAGIPDAFAHWTGLQIEAHQAPKVYYRGFRLRIAAKNASRPWPNGVVCRNPAAFRSVAASRTASPNSTGTVRNSGCRSRNVATTRSFSSGSLEHVA